MTSPADGIRVGGDGERWPDAGEIEEKIMRDHPPVEDILRKVSINPALPVEQRQQIQELIAEFADIFADEPGMRARVNQLMPRMKLKPGAKPVATPPYFYSPVVNKAIQRTVEKLARLELIVPCNGPWAAPIVMVRKPHVKNIEDPSDPRRWRMCIDYRGINQWLVPDRFPMPRIQDLHHRLRGAAIFTSLDATCGYWQVPVHPGDRPMTAFVTRDGLWMWTVMPQGLAPAPASFQRFMQSAIGAEGGLHSFTMVYLDDCIVHSGVFEEHLVHLRRLFERLRRAHISLKPKKCFFGFSKLNFLGFVASGEGIRADPEKVKAISEWPVPRTLKQVQRFLGAASWLRDTVEGFADLAAPLYKLQKKGQKFIWEAEQQAAFEALKTAIGERALLHHPDWEKPFHVHVDASDEGVGAVLWQLGSDGEKKPIIFASKRLSKAQKKWTAGDKEAFAAVWAIKDKFRPFLMGQKFTLHTDHANLRFLMRQKKGKLARWGLILSQHLEDMTIEHVKGKDNGMADGLSRQEREPDDENDGVERRCVNTAIIMDKLRSWQLADDRFGDIIRFLEEKKLPEDDRLHDRLKKSAHHYQIDGQGVLRCISAPMKHAFGVQPPVCVPADKVEAVLREVHNASHDGVRRTQLAAARRFWWPKMRKSIAKFVRNCEDCAKAKAVKRKRQSVVRARLFARPFELLGMDLWGPLPGTSKGHKWVLTIIDAFTRFVFFIPLKDATAETVRDVLINDVFAKFGFCRAIHTDNGPQFTADVFKHTCERLKIRHTTSLPHHPQGNGLTERIHRELKARVRIFLKTLGKSWDDWLGPIALALNAGQLSTTEFSPFELMFGRKPDHLPSDLTNPVGEQSRDLAVHGKELIGILKAAWEQAAKDMEFAKLKSVENANKETATRTESKFRVGDLVLLRRPVRSDKKAKLSSKLRFDWIGPFRIIDKPRTNTAKLLNVFTGKEERAHVDNLAPFTPELVAKHNAAPADPDGPFRKGEIVLMDTALGPFPATITADPDEDDKLLHVHWKNTRSAKTQPLHKRIFRDAHVDPTDGKIEITNKPAARFEPELGMVDKSDVLLRHLEFSKRTCKFTSDTALRIQDLSLH